MQCLYVAGTLIGCSLIGGVSAYERLKVQCLYVAGTMTECPLRRCFCLWEVKNAVFVCGWDQN